MNELQSLYLLIYKRGNMLLSIYLFTYSIIYLLRGHSFLRLNRLALNAVLLPWPPGRWDCRSVSPCPGCFSTFNVPGNHCTSCWNVSFDWKGWWSLTSIYSKFPPKGEFLLLLRLHSEQQRPTRTSSALYVMYNYGIIWACTDYKAYTTYF